MLSTLTETTVPVWFMLAAVTIGNWFFNYVGSQDSRIVAVETKVEQIDYSVRRMEYIMMHVYPDVKPPEELNGEDPIRSTN